jgi:hypothetical protein
MKAIVVPIDNRPVTYVFPQLIGKIAGVEILAPPRNLMGSLQAITNVEAVSDWLSSALSAQKPSGLLVCMDTIIYGGLIPSRRGEETPAQLVERAKAIPRWKKASPGLKVYAQSSIMRVSDNYDATEEKQYWARYGREIYAWSEGMHRAMSTASSGSDESRKRAAELTQLEARVPADIRKDYLDTRTRNFQLNRKLMEYAESGDLDFLVFSQDDSGEYGLNVAEKEKLQAESSRRGLKNVYIYAGADEVLMTMMGRWLIQELNIRPSVRISFSPEAGGGIASRYEGQTIGSSVKLQTEAIGLTTTGAKPDLHLIVHTSGDRQGDHIWLQGHPDLRAMNTKSAVERTIELLEESSEPCVLCDVAYSNGSDPMLIEELVKRPELLKKLWGYAGWNTTGNSLGSALAMGVARWFAEKKETGAQADEALKNALFIRLADDWAYQTQVRKDLGQELSRDKLRDLMSPHLTALGKALEMQPSRVDLDLPWQRSFEIEIRHAYPETNLVS